MVKLSTLALGLLTVVAQVSAQQTVKVMPFGASIVSKCWRANLQAKLRSDQTTNFDFIGSQKSTCSGTDVDQDHEGHPGSQATDFAANGNLTVWLNQNTPDVILMLLGTNDILIGKKSTGDIIKAYDVLIGQMRAKNPKMHIIFSNLLPLDTKRWPQTAQDGIVNLNAAIKQYAPSKNTRDSPVTFVDNFDGFNAVSDTTDGEHPNDSGNEKMASKFFLPTRNAIKAISGTDASPKGQAQQVQEQPATPTLITPSVKSTVQAPSTTPTPTPSSSQAPSTSVAVSTSTSVDARPQASRLAVPEVISSVTSSSSSERATSVTLEVVTSATSETRTSATQGTQQTSSATSLRLPWPLSVLKSMRWALSIAGPRQSVLSA